MEKKAHVNGNSKQVRCITTGILYDSMTLAAIENGVSVPSMSQAIHNERKCKGKEFTLENDVQKTVHQMSKRIQELSKDSEDARKWRTYQAELEAARKAELKRQEDIAKATEKRNRWMEICERLQTELLHAEQNYMEAENELNSMNGIVAENVA